MNRDEIARKESETELDDEAPLKTDKGGLREKVVSSPAKLILSIMASVFVVEAIIMLILATLPQVSLSTAAFIDAFVLTLFLTPLVYLLIYRQLNEHIKKRQDAEGAHMVSAEHLRSVVESAADSIISMDSKGKIIFWNAVAEKVFGYRKEDILGKSVTIIIPDEKKEGYSKVLDRLHIIGENRHTKMMFEEVALRKDGRSFPVEFSLAYWRTDDGEFYTAVIRDISERKIVNEALASSRKMFLTVLDTIPVRVFWKDKNLNYLGCNAPFAKDAGFESPISLIGRDDFYMPWSDQANLYRDDDRKVIESGEASLNFEEPQIRPDGTLSFLRTSKIPLRDGDGNIMGVLGVYEDITEQKLAENTLKARRRQQAVVAELGQLALSGVELSELFDKTVSTMAETLGVKFTKILELLPDKVTMLLRSGVGWNSGLVGRLIMNVNSESQAGYTLSVNEPVVVEDLGSDNRFSGPALLMDHNVLSGVSVIIGNIVNPFGVLGVHSTQKKIFTSDDVNFLQAVANVLAEAVRSKETEKSFEALFKSTAGSTGEEFFYNTVESMKEWLDADCVIIGEFVDEGMVDALAMVLDNTKVLQFSYPLSGSPCEEVSKGGMCVYPSGVAQEFPEDKILVEMGAQGYAGVPLYSRDGKAIGILCALSRSRLTLPSKGKEIFEIIAAKVGVEIERRHAEEERQKLSQAIEQSPATVVITDIDGNIEYVNPKFTEMTGYTAKEAYGKNTNILKSGHTSDKEYKELWDRIKSGKEWYGEFLNKRKDGTLFWEAASISPVMDKEGNITSFIAVKEDITEKKRSESMITRIGRILENSSNEIYIFDADSLKYLEANRGARENLGYTMDELSDLTPVDLKPDITKMEFEKILEPLRSGKEEKIEFNATHMRKDGTTFPAEIHLETTTFESSPAFVSIILDQTKRMEAEAEKGKLQAQLVQAQKMEAVGVLAAGVAHDFNNILTVIRLRAENAMEEVGEDSPAFEDMKEALEASKNASDLTRQLLLFSRKQAMEFINGDINVTIVSLLKMLGRLIGENYSVKTELDTSLQHTRFDRVGVELMIVNLAINSRDAMPDGGSIIIKTANITFDDSNIDGHPEARPGKFVCLSVLDEGAGMDEKTLEHIFEPFFTTKGVGKGTGLGLSVVYGIIMEHKGWVEVRSEIGKSTEFLLYIPVIAKSRKDKVKSKIKKDRARGDGKRILLVEDEAGLREITSKLLKISGFEVFEAEDYKMAQDVFKREEGEFDLLLSDVILPDKTGIQLAEDLKKKNPNLKLLLSSGYTDERSQWPLIREKGYKFLQKPYSLDELIENVMEAIEEDG